MTTVTRLRETRAVSTPAATMRTYASPSTQSDLPFAVWRTELPAGATGPRHAVDVDQYMVVLEGAVQVEVGDELTALEAGDGIRLPAHVTRQITAPGASPALLLTAGTGGARATVGDDDPVVIPWSA